MDNEFGASAEADRALVNQAPTGLGPPGFDPSRERGLVERLRGPVQWGYMCLADGGFIADDTPVEAASALESRSAIEAPENNEPDEQWRSIKRAIDHFVGRVPSIGKHRAVNTAHIQAVVARLDAADDREAADTIVWLCWHRALDQVRERFLLADKDEQLAEVRRTNDGAELRVIGQRMLDDHQTSEAHHPDHVLVNRRDFELLRAAIMRIVSDPPDPFRDRDASLAEDAAAAEPRSGGSPGPKGIAP
jgi:hypothetical protein